MPALTLKRRILLSLGGNALRSLLGFITSIVIARGLSPAGYGDLMFLLGSFSAIRVLLDMGTSSAFFTFISQRRYHSRFYAIYFGWIALQFVVTLLLVAISIPFHVFQTVWLGHELPIVLLAATAAFIQQQVWPCAGQVADSQRRTRLTQGGALLATLTYLVIVSILLAMNLLHVELVLWALTATYVLATMAVAVVLSKGEGAERVDPPPPSVMDVLREFVRYCRPLAVLAILAFAYEFADRWLLQRFAGAVQQGIFQVANQIAAVSLLATSAVLSIFWKEIAAAWGENDDARLKSLYRKASRILIFLGAFVGGGLIPWSPSIVEVLLGPAYADAWPVLAVMLIYPVHQSLGQIGGTTLLATGRTGTYLLVSSAMMALSLPLGLFLLLPPGGGLPGLDMGALGLAIKLVVVGVVGGNLQSWTIARIHGWNYEWAFQIVVVGALVTSGVLGRLVAGLSFPATLSGTLGVALLPPITVAILVHSSLALALVLLFPRLIGLERHELAALAAQVRGKLRWN